MKLITKKKKNSIQYPATLQLASQINQNSPPGAGRDQPFQKPLTTNTGAKWESVSKEKEGEWCWVGRQECPTQGRCLQVALKENFPLAKLS